MELRANNDVEAIRTPTGFIPKYQDLKPLFESILSQKYSEEDYVKQFSIRVKENLAKVDRILKIYQGISDRPAVVFDELKAQQVRLIKAQKDLGDYINPDDLY
jgi:phosphoenolpyruvate carboxykinase (GTP)